MLTNALDAALDSRPAAPSMIVVFSFSTRSFLLPQVVQRRLLERQADFIGDDRPPSGSRLSCSMALRRSRSPRLDAATWTMPRMVLTPTCKRFAFHISATIKRTATLGMVRAAATVRGCWRSSVPPTGSALSRGLCLIVDEKYGAGSRVELACLRPLRALRARAFLNRGSTPSLPTFAIASAIRLAMPLIGVREIVPTCAIDSDLWRLEIFFSSSVPRNGLVDAAPSDHRGYAARRP